MQLKLNVSCDVGDACAVYLFGCRDTEHKD